MFRFDAFPQKAKNMLYDIIVTLTFDPKKLPLGVP